MDKKKQIYINYNRQNKWLGIIDYKSLLVSIIYGLIIILVLKNIKFNFIISFYIFIILMSPLLVLIFITTKNGSAIDVLLIIIKYFLKNKMYINTKYYNNDRRYLYK